jgi:hypothetical protein
LPQSVSHLILRLLNYFMEVTIGGVVRVFRVIPEISIAELFI